METIALPVNTNKIFSLMDHIMKEAFRQQMDPHEILIALDYIQEFITDTCEIPKENIIEIQAHAQDMYNLTIANHAQLKHN